MIFPGFLVNFQVFFSLLPPATKLGQCYIFTGICHFVNRGVLSQHALQVVSQHALQQVSRGGSAPGGGVPAPGVGGDGCLLWGGACSRGVGACSGGCGLLLWPSGLVAFWLKAAFWYGLLGGQKAITRPPHQKAITEGGAWWRPPRTATAAGGMHPTGMHSCS